MKKAGIIVLSFWGLYVLLISSCATNIPVTSNINDFVMMGIKTNREDAVSLKIISNIHDGAYPVLKQDGTESGTTINIPESSVLSRMVNEYAATKFSKFSDDGTSTITVTLKEFSLQNYTTESTGMQVLRAFAGTNAGAGYIIGSRIFVTVDVERNGESETKNISATTEENYEGGSMSSSVQKYAADCINSTNNKVLMQMNAFFEELGI
jgi:hypothetical protein